MSQEHLENEGTGEQYEIAQHRYFGEVPNEQILGLQDGLYPDMRVSRTRVYGSLIVSEDRLLPGENTFEVGFLDYRGGKGGIAQIDFRKILPDDTVGFDSLLVISDEHGNQTIKTSDEFPDSISINDVIRKAVYGLEMFDARMHLTTRDDWIRAQRNIAYDFVEPGDRLLMDYQQAHRILAEYLRQADLQS